MSEATRPLRVAVIGAGPAGIYAADLITKSEEVRSGAVEVSIDIFDRYPAPFGLIRYGVAPDHPRIKGIITALHKVLDRGDIRFFGNVEYGKDLNLADLREQAGERARQSLALDALATKLAFEATEEDVRAEFERAGVDDVDKSIAEFTQSGQMPAVRESIRRTKAVNWLVENATVTEVDEVAEKRAQKDAE